MTRLIITGRNNSMPRDAAQSMAYLMPVQRSSITTDSATRADSAAGASGHPPDVSSPGAHPTIAGAAQGARS